MITIIYKELFEVVLLHDFFTDGKCTALELQPAASCMQALRQAGLRCLPTPNGIKVLAKADKTGSAANPVYTIKTPLPENSRFLFLMQPKTPAFETFSQTNMERPGGTVYYFNNLGPENPDSNGLPSLVRDAAAKKVSDSDLVRVEQGVYGFVASGNTAKKAGTLQGVDSGVMFHEDMLRNNNKYFFSFNLARAPEGRMTFQVDGVEKDAFYNLPSVESAACLGLVEIFHRAALPEAHRFVLGDGTMGTKIYPIHFANRATRWRYFINRKFNSAVNSVSVQKTGSGSIGFTAQGGLPAGEFVVASNAAVPLREQPVTGIQLKDQGNKVLIAHLPNPAFTHLKKEGSELYSDVFITI